MSAGKKTSWLHTVATKPWHRLLVVALRLVVGAVFVFSGFVKAVDPWGGMYKIIDYAHALQLPSLASVALGAGFALAAAEFVLGLSVIAGVFRRGAVALLLCMMAVMLPLTVWLATTGAVPDCGCFGDALVLSNGASLAKNVVLTLLLIYLLLQNRSVPGLFGPAVGWVVGLLGLAFVTAVAYYGYFYQPLIDFRPFPVGSTIGVEGDEDVSDEDYEFIYKKDGHEQAFGIDSLPDEEQGWEYVDRRFRPGREPKRHDIGQSAAVFNREGDEVTADVLPMHGRQVLFLFPDLREMNPGYAFSLNQIARNAASQGIAAVAATGADTATIDWWTDITLPPYPIYQMDDSQVKTIARGNPAVVMVRDGKVVWKRALASMASDRVRQRGFPVSQLSTDFDPGTTLRHLAGLFGLALLILLVVNRTHVVVIAFVREVFKKKSQPAASDDDNPIAPDDDDASPDEDEENDQEIEVD